MITLSVPLLFCITLALWAINNVDVSCPFSNTGHAPALRTDIVVLSCAATPENKHLICQESLSRMKRGVYIVNVARGSLIHEDDLLAAMESGHVSGAALEVFEKEPLVKQTVQSHPRLILGSHNASNTQEGVEKTNDLVMQFLNGN